MRRLIATYRAGESVQVSLPGNFPGSEEDPFYVIDDPIKINPPGGRLLITGPQFPANNPANAKFTAQHAITFSIKDVELLSDTDVSAIVKSWKASNSKSVNVDVLGCVGLESSVSRMAERIASETKSPVNVTLW